MSPIDDKYYVLFADTFGYRHQQFRVRSGTTKCSVIQRHAHSAGEFIISLREREWDVVFIPGFFEREDNFQEAITAIAKEMSNKPPRLVVFHGADDTFHIVEQLSNIGLPVIHVPWNFMEPSKHVRVPMKKKGDVR